MHLKSEGLTAKRDGYQTPDNGQGYWSSKGGTQRLKQKYTHSDSLEKKTSLEILKQRLVFPWVCRLASHASSGQRQALAVYNFKDGDHDHWGVFMDLRILSISFGMSILPSMSTSTSDVSKCRGCSRRTKPSSVWKPEISMVWPLVDDACCCFDCSKVFPSARLCAYGLWWWSHIAWLAPRHRPGATCNARLSNFVGFWRSCDDGVSTPSFSIPDSSSSRQLSSIHSHMFAKPKGCQRFDAWHICWLQSGVFHHVVQRGDQFGVWKDTPKKKINTWELSLKMESSSCGVATKATIWSNRGYIS